MNDQEQNVKTTKIRKIFSTIQEGMTLVFGRPSWNLPPWLKWLTEKIVFGFNKCLSGINNARRGHPKMFWGGIIAALILSGGGFGGYLYYKSLPKPIVFTVTGQPPTPTVLEEPIYFNSLFVYFSGSSAPLDMIGKEVITGITMMPQVKGKWFWTSDVQLSFAPSEDWPVDTKFTVKFEKELFAKHVKLDKMKYEFNTEPFTATVQSNEFYQDPVDPKNKRAVTALKFNYPVDEMSLEKAVTVEMEQPSKKLNFTISYNKLRGEAYIKSEPVEIPDDDTKIKFTIDSGVSSARGGEFKDKIKTDVTVPGMFTFFRIDNANLIFANNEKYETEQVMVIETTGAVSEAQVTKNIKAYILPKDRPQVEGLGEAVENYQWYNVSEIGPEVLKLAKPLELEPIPTEREYSALHSYKYDATPDKFVYLKISKGMKAFGGYLLAKDYEKVIKVPSFPKEVKIMYSGSLLSMSGDKKISVMTRDVPAVCFTLGRILPHQINHLISQTSGDFSKPYFMNYYFNKENITETIKEFKVLEKTALGHAQYTAFDFAPYLSGDEKEGLFFFEAAGCDAKKKTPLGSSDSRIIIVTDMGLLAKESTDGTRDLFIQSISSGQPLSGVTVEILGKNGLPIFSKQTDENGHVSFASLKDFKNEKTPVVYVARQGNDVSFLPYNREDRKLNYSRFEVGGVVTDADPQRLDVYLFSERGIYRPGEEFHIGMIIKAVDWRRDLTGIPVEVVISDPRGLEIEKKKIELSGSGFEETSYVTEEGSPTGTYRVSVYIVKDNKRSTLLGSTDVKVEEFMPDRLRIVTALSKDVPKGWVEPEELKGEVDLFNLFGTPAIGRRVSSTISLAPAKLYFGDYKDYNFFDPLKPKEQFFEKLEDETTDDSGHAEFDLDLKRFDKGSYRLDFSAEGYELEGGRGVFSKSSILVSPLKYIVGFKADGNLSYVSRDSQRGVNIIALNSTLEKVPANLKASFIEYRYVSVLTKQESGLYKYESVKKEIEKKAFDLAITAKGLAYNLPTKDVGNFGLVIKDELGVEQNRIDFSVAGEGNLAMKLEKNAELMVKLNKTDFLPDEEIELQITAPYTGAGLITIERERIYAYSWFKTDSTNTVQRIKVPADLEGNGYVNVAFIRGLDSSEIFMSPLSYAVAPFTVNTARRFNKIDITVSETSEPGKSFKIKYKTERPTKMVLFGVDEGILQVAGYKTPDPLSYFFKKKALSVITSQILDLILPEYSMAAAVSAPGGGEDLELGKNLNPFKRRALKPVVFWSGIIDASPKEQEYVYEVPDYFNGTLRIMAVAVSKDSVGVGQKKSFIKGPFVINPNVPTFVSPGDEFDLSIAVANNVVGSGEKANVEFEVKPTEHLEIVGESKISMEIPEGREKSAIFKVKVKDVLGEAGLKFKSSFGEKSSKYTSTLSVRPSVPYLTSVKSGYFKDKTDVVIDRTMYPDFRILETSYSTVPLGLASGLSQYLKKFPYGCTEQITSQAFASLILKSRPEFGYSAKDADEIFDRAIRILSSRQNEDGAFGFWAANSFVSDFQTVYVLHFLTESATLGHKTPKDVLKKGLEYLKNVAGYKPDTLANARISSYALYVLTRNGLVMSDAMSSLAEAMKTGGPSWENDLAGVYLAASEQLLQKKDEASDLIANAKFNTKIVPDYDNFYDDLVFESQLLYILARHFPERLTNIPKEDLQSMVNMITSESYNTISSAYSILAFSAYADALGSPTAGSVLVTQEMLDNTKKELVFPVGLFPKTDVSDDAKSLAFQNSGDAGLYYQLVEAGFDKTPPATEIKQKLEVQREFRDENGNVVASTAVGGSLMVHLKIRSIEAGGYQNVAVVDLLPGGFEVEFNSIREDDNQEPPSDAYSNDENGEGEVDGDDGEVEGEGEGGNEEYNYEEEDQTPPSVALISQSESTLVPDYVDIREDRVIIYGPVSEEAKEFVYKIRAVNKGNFTVPPSYGESMYDRSVKARSISSKITVGDAK